MMMSPLNPPLRRLTADLSEFEASLVYTVNSRTAKATQKNKNQKQNNKMYKSPEKNTCVSKHSHTFKIKNTIQF